MLWNWYTVDTCFIAETWHNTSRGMFAGSCIGVILLVMTLELLRRSVKEYDRYLIRRHTTRSAAAPAAVPASGEGSEAGSSHPDSKAAFTTGGAAAARIVAAGTVGGYRPTIFEQAIRALLHMLQFAVAYFVML